MKNIIVLLTFLVPAFSFAVTEPVACTMDAKLCPDGVTYVGRVAPSCAFAACPGETKPLPPICANLSFDLDIGATDATTQGEVSVIQNFLYPEYLKVKSTGAFYGLTRAALAQFQKDNGIFPARGYLGSLTRAKIKELICNGGVVQGPTINVLDPKTAKVGETVTLTGPGLNTGGDYVLFGGYRIETHAIKAANRISFTVPETVSKTIYCITTPCPQTAPEKVLSGAYSIQVVNNVGKSNTVVLTIIDGTVVVPPVNDKISISFVEPRAAKVGASVVIYGYNLFRPETRILFDGHSIKGQPIYTKRLGDFNSALEFTVPSYLSSCSGFVCTAGLGRKVTPGGYELAVDNKYGRAAVKFEVLGDVAVGGKPYLQYSSPTQGVVGSEVYVFGENLNTGSEKIYFGGSQVSSLSLSTDRKGSVHFKIPEYITPCGYEDGIMCRMMAQLVTPGKYDIVVKNKDGLSNTLSFVVVSSTANQKPEITSLAPSVGPIGTEVGIRGTGINSSDNKIYFGGSLVPSAYTISSAVSGGIVNAIPFFRVPDYITPCGVGNENLCKIASIPVTQGKYDVVVVNKNGTSNSLSFEVTGTGIPNPQKPTLQALTPSSAKVGESVRITGTNINIGDDKVYFSGTLVSRMTTDGIDLPNTLSFVVPSSYQACPIGTDCKIMSQEVVPGVYPITVINKHGQSNSLQLTVVGSTVPPVTPAITITSPNGGNVYSVGDTMNITWNSSNVPTQDTIKVKLFVRHNDPTYPGGQAVQYDLLWNVPNTGSFSWKIPEFYNRGHAEDAYYVQLVTSSGVSDTSNAPFTIKKLSRETNEISVVAPYSGARYFSGQAVDVTWSRTQNISWATYLLKASDPSFTRTIVSLYKDASTVVATIPTNIPVGSDYYLKVVEIPLQSPFQQKTGYSGWFQIN